MFLALLQTVKDDDGINITEGTVVWVLLVVLLIVAILAVASYIRRP